MQPEKVIILPAYNTANSIVVLKVSAQVIPIHDEIVTGKHVPVNKNSAGYLNLLT